MTEVVFDLPTKRLMDAIGALFLVLSAIFALLGLSYVIYWGPAPESLPISVAPFPFYAFWLGIVFFIVGIIAMALTGYGRKESPSP